MAGLILFFDAVFLFTLFISVLTLKIELQRLRQSSGQPETNLRVGDATAALKSEKKKESSLGSRIKLFLVRFFVLLRSRKYLLKLARLADSWISRCTCLECLYLDLPTGTHGPVHHGDH